MKVKNKITLGLGFLFTVIVVLSFISIYYLNMLNVQNQELLEENYLSLNYVHGLERSLNEIRNSFEPEEDSRVSLNKMQYRLDPAIESFRANLSKIKGLDNENQEELLAEIEVNFTALTNFIEVTRTKDYYFEKLIPLIQDLNQMINQVYVLNQQAISHRSEMARATAQRVIYTVVGIVALFLIIAISFIIGFPRFIAEPVEKLSEAIEDIKAGNYETRVEIETRDEFGALGTAFNEMAQRLDEFEKMNLQKLMLEKKRIETMVQKISEGIIGMDADFNILFINPFARRALGMPNEDLTGQSAKDLGLKREILQTVVSDLVEHAATGKRYTRNKLVKGNLKDKPAYFIRKVIITYAEDESENELNGYIIMLKNITEYKELDEARTNFIATISHELKTPISAMRMSLKLLRDQRLSKLSEDQEELIDSVEWEVNRLLNITQELLNANEVETGKMQLHPEFCSMQDIIDEAVDSIVPLAEDRDIELTEKLPENMPLVNVDQDKLTWVLINFLTNAIKYSPVGSEVQLQVKADDKDLHIDVIDEGEGIPKEEQKRIFDRYYRMPGSEGKGTGLGLSISKEIVQLMNGKIGVDSSPGKGARFYIQLPGILQEEHTSSVEKS